VCIGATPRPESCCEAKSRLVFIDCEAAAGSPTPEASAFPPRPDPGWTVLLDSSFHSPLRPDYPSTSSTSATSSGGVRAASAGGGCLPSVLSSFGSSSADMTFGYDSEILEYWSFSFDFDSV